VGVDGQDGKGLQLQLEKKVAHFSQVLPLDCLGKSAENHFIYSS